MELSQRITRFFTDVTRMKAPPQDVVTLHTEAQKVAHGGWFEQDGSNWSGADIIAKMAVDRFSKESGMHKGTFDNWREADELAGQEVDPARGRRHDQVLRAVMLWATHSRAVLTCYVRWCWP